MTPFQLAYTQRVQKLYPVGRVYGRLTVTGHERQVNGTWWVVCRCTCGKKYAAKHPCHLRNGLVRSCGCLSRELARARRLGKPAQNQLPHGEAALRLAWRTYRLHAKRKQREFRLTQAEFTALVYKNCEYCGQPPEQRKAYGRYNGAPKMNGVDRVNSRKGYTKSNCVACCKQCNRAKSNLTVSAFKKWIKRVSLHIS